MSQDARFEDGGEAPLYLGALDPDDLGVLAALVQDSVFVITDMTWSRPTHRFAILLNRFRWEDATTAENRRDRPFERVRSVLAFDNVISVASQGIDRRDKDIVLSLLSVAFEPGDDGTGQILLTLAGDGAIRLDVEALDVTLRDVTRPYAAPSGRAPNHGN
ncbi:MAG: DUF2948 family protein [Marinibacterium sp.]